jgi:hypothetical protein
MNANDILLKELFLFFHIEKCGGTSLLASSRRRKGLRHCDILTSNTSGNIASVTDFSKSLSLYKSCDFITGHCLYPGLITDYKNIAHSRGYKPVTITSIRNPMDRLLSDYAHARRRGEVMNLDNFLRIPFKQNYICNFWGKGNPETALERLNKIDYVIKIEDLEEFIYFINTNHEIKLTNAAHSNASKIDELPDDLTVEGGVRASKYSISEENYRFITENNIKDTQLLENINFWSPAAKHDAKALTEIDAADTKQTWAWLYRNLVYKPLMQRRLGIVILKRNSIPHSIDSDIDYMWAE